MHAFLSNFEPSIIVILESGVAEILDVFMGDFVPILVFKCNLLFWYWRCILRCWHVSTYSDMIVYLYIRPTTQIRTFTLYLKSDLNFQRYKKICCWHLYLKIYLWYIRKRCVMAHSGCIFDWFVVSIISMVCIFVRHNFVKFPCSILDTYCACKLIICDFLFFRSQGVARVILGKISHLE